jgi:hypothetical protein
LVGCRRNLTESHSARLLPDTIFFVRPPQATLYHPTGRHTSITPAAHHHQSNTHLVSVKVSVACTCA